MTIDIALMQGAAKLQRVGLDAPRFEAEVLLSHLLNCNRAMLYAHNKDALTERQLQQFETGIDRRAHHEPMAYITGHREFMDLDLIVTKDVLIPRPDTEVVVEAGLAWLKDHPQAIKVLDLCTGSGAIGLSIKNEMPHLDVTLTDLSEKALAVAKQNAEKFSLDVDLQQGDLYEAIGTQQYDMIISNPPYIPPKVIATLEQDVKDYEPVMALDGGETGFDFYDRIIAGANDHLYPRG